MDLHQLECLVAIAKTGTVSQAAELLMISQPAVTRAIKSLETELGYPLFERQNNRLKLNSTGELAVEHAQKILTDKEKMLESLSSYQKSKQCISIGSCAPAPLWGLKQIFQKVYPNIPLDSIISDDNISLIEGFRNYQYSMLILDYPINDKNLISTKLFDETLYIAVKPEDPLSQLKSVTFEQLNGTNFLVLSKIGYWSEICNDQLSQSLMIVQDDIVAYKTLLNVSSLATFRTNLTIPKFKNIEDRVYIPISNKEATLTFYAIYRKEDQSRYDVIKNEISNILWETYRDEDPF